MYHHHHKLQHPLEVTVDEPAVTEDVAVNHLMNRAIGQILTQTGFDLAEPVAMEGLRYATEECTTLSISVEGFKHLLILL
jgi:hypothetical protein